MTLRSALLVASVTAIYLGVGVRETRLAAVDEGHQPPVDLNPVAAACGGEPCDAVIRGGAAFVDRRLSGLGGNGRSCADCHMPTDSFQLSPADVETRFQLMQWLRQRNPRADDPLFRPIDADDFRTRGDQASDFSNLRQNGLVRIALPLPPNVRLIDPATNLPSAETTVDLWRSVPSVNNVALSGPGTINPWPRGPNVFGGYQLDARVGTLQEQALGAFVNHAQVQQPPPGPRARRSVVVRARVVHESPRSRTGGCD